MTQLRTISLVALLSLFGAWTLAWAGAESAPSLQGTWLGTLEIAGTKLRLVFNITAGPDGTLAATLDSPDQGAKGIAVSRVSTEDGTVVLESAVIGGRYEGTLDDDNSAIDGKWMQRGISLPLRMERVDEVAMPARPQEPKKPYPYLEQEVTFRNTEADATIAGTLTRPKAGGPFPAVILITGSGAQDRDETVFGHRPFLVLADYLTRRGLAVLRTDDRGVGGSMGDVMSVTSRDFAGDVLAGVAYLKGRADIDPNRIGLIGHSEGGLIAPMAAAQSKDVAFIVLMAGPGVSGEKIVEGQIARLLQTAGADQAKIDGAIESQRQVCRIVRTETDIDVMKQKVREILTKSVSQLDENQRRAMGYSEAYVEMQTEAAASKWFRFFLAHDPKPTLSQVTCPVLAINGALDIQVPAEENLAAVSQALAEGGNTHVTTKCLAQLNHLFQTAQTGAISEYAQIEETMAPMTLKTMGDWIQEQVARP